MATGGACCGPAAPIGAARPQTLPAGGASAALRADVQAHLTPIRGGFFDMGARKPRHPADLDGPPRRVKLSDYQIGCTTITNAMFAAFAAETGYRSTAELEGWSYVFHLFLDAPEKYRDYAAQTPWWRRVDGAFWACPEGPGSDIQDRSNHPVTHVSWYDAQAFCAYTDTRLPREAEWEYAARGGQKGKLHPWGNRLVPDSGHAQNVWQGDFPNQNLAEDGYVGTAPADSYGANGFGLYNMTGNVWEWCADGFGPLPEAAQGQPARDPCRSAEGVGRIIRGGSYLCHASYCERYFVHSRTSNTPDSTTGHTGFRVVGDNM